MVEKLVIFCPLYKSSKTYNPKAVEVEKNIKLNIIFNFKAESIGMKEAQLLIKSEIKIMNRNLSYLKLLLKISGWSIRFPAQLKVEIKKWLLPEKVLSRH